MNWSLLREIQATYKKRKEQLKLLVKFPNKKLNPKWVKAKDLLKVTWDSFDNNAEAIFIANKNSQILFAYQRVMYPSKNNHCSDSVSGRIIHDWGKLDEEQAAAWLDILTQKILASLET